MLTRILLLAAVVLASLAGSSFGQAVLRPNDQFEMQLSGMPVEYAADFRALYTVGDDGTVTVPLIGSIRAGGLSAAQLSRAIERKLVADKIFTNPTVLLTLGARSRTVTVGGSVRAPQAMEWTGDLTLSTAIKRAGGTTEWGNIKKVRVTRGGKTSIFDLRRADRDPNQNPSLLPGDEVEVPE